MKTPPPRTWSAVSSSAAAILTTLSTRDDASPQSSTPTDDAPPIITQQPRPTILATSDAAAERASSDAALRRLRSLAKNKTDESSIETNSGSVNEIPRIPQHSPQSTPSPDESYPTFTPYHQSLLKKYLTPQLWSRLCHKRTKYGTTIEDMIRPGLMLPLGAHPPRRVGLLAGDADCYTVFEELINPIVGEYHGLKSGWVDGEDEDWEDPELPRERYFEKKEVSDGREEEGVIKSGAGGEEDSFEDEEWDGLGDSSQSSPEKITETAQVATQQQKPRPNLRRHSTIINNPLLVSSKQVDPENKYIISTRIRIARSLSGIRFPTTMSRAERRHVQSLVWECCANFHSPKVGQGIYLPVLSMTTDQNLDLIERHILFDNPNEWTIAAGLGRDWPDGRGLYANVSDLYQTPDFIVWVNEEDHLRLMCLRKGGDIQGVFTTLMTGVRELERELRTRGWEFAFHPKLGYLTCCPTNVGTTMRASVHVRLAKLGRLQGFRELVQALKLEVRGKHGETDRAATGIFDISNAERLGKSEVHLINVMVEGVAMLIELERRLERGEVVDCEAIAREIR